MLPFYTSPSVKNGLMKTLLNTNMKSALIPAKSFHASKAVRDFSLGQGAQAKA